MWVIAAPDGRLELHRHRPLRVARAAGEPGRAADGAAGLRLVQLRRCSTPTPPLVYTWAAITGGLWGGLFLHLGIAFPSGRLRPGSDRALVIAGYVIFPLAFVPTLLFNGDDPRNLLLIEADDGPDRPHARASARCSTSTLFVLVVIRSARPLPARATASSACS